MPGPLKLNGNCAAYSRNYVHSWEQELGRPRHVVDKMWQNMQSHDTETMTLDKDIEENLWMRGNKLGGMDRPKQQGSGQRKKKTIRN